MNIYNIMLDSQTQSFFQEIVRLLTLDVSQDLLLLVTD